MQIVELKLKIYVYFRKEITKVQYFCVTKGKFLPVTKTK